MDLERKSNRRGLFFMLGIAAGAAAGWYLNSDNGRKLRRESAEAIGEWSEKAAKNAQDLVEKSKSYAEELSEKFNSNTSSAEEMADDIIKMQN